MAELSLAEKYYVFSHREIDAKQLSKDLGVRLPTVKKYLKEIEGSFAAEKVETPMVPRGEELAKAVVEAAPVPKPSVSDKFVIKKDPKDPKSQTRAVVASQTSSELGDEFRKTNQTFKNNPNVFMVPK
jgi:hypothetical protein